MAGSVGGLRPERGCGAHAGHERVHELQHPLERPSRRLSVESARAGAIVRRMAMSSEDKAAALARLPLFAGISAESMTRLAAVAGEQEFRGRSVHRSAGPGGHRPYVIVDGSVKVVRGDDELATLGAGEFFGELSVIDQQPRFASVQATQPTRVARHRLVGPAGTARIGLGAGAQPDSGASSNASAMRASSTATRSRSPMAMSQQELVDTLAGLTLFADLSRPQIEAVAHKMTEESYPTGPAHPAPGLHRHRLLRDRRWRGRDQDRRQRRSRAWARVTSSVRCRSCSVSRRWQTSSRRASCASCTWVGPSSRASCASTRRSCIACSSRWPCALRNANRWRS